MQKLKLLSVFSFLLLACGKPLPTFDEIDMAKWKEDKNGCQLIRQSSIDALDRQREKIKSLSEADVVELLGRPDRNELLKRNQKFYYYYLQPGTPCSNNQAEFRKLMIRFNAIGLAKEVSIE